MTLLDTPYQIISLHYLSFCIGDHSTVAVVESKYEGCDWSTAVNFSIF
jgi:hypothetical protein